MTEVLSRNVTYASSSFSYAFVFFVSVLSSASFAVAAWVFFVMMQQVASANHTFLSSQANIIKNHWVDFLGLYNVFLVQRLSNKEM